MPSKAQFTVKTKKEIFERDGGSCVFCTNPATDCHHAWYGTESNYWPNRNKSNQWLLLCRDHHNLAHSCSKGEWIRQKCIDYLESL
jgi:hypothetical protein